MNYDQLIEDMKAEIAWEQEQVKCEILEQWEEAK
jgi:hypothetical protein